MNHDLHLSQGFAASERGLRSERMHHGSLGYSSRLPKFAWTKNTRRHNPSKLGGMPTLESTFHLLKQRNEKALVLFVTAGDPDLSQLPDILDTLQDAGADVIEVGLPFSDPIADGPVIQASSQRALDRGVTTKRVLETLKNWKDRARVPVVLMGYMNPVLRFGLDEFAKSAREAGCSGTIISDLTPEESDEWVQASRRHGLDNIFLAAPTSTDERLDEVCRRASGFVYAVSRTGVTGSGESSQSQVSSLVARIKVRTSLPVCVGFGISRPDQVRQVCETADGAVIGSWLVDQLAREWQDGSGRAGLLADVAALKSATRM